VHGCDGLSVAVACAQTKAHSHPVNLNRGEENGVARPLTAANLSSNLPPFPFKASSMPLDASLESTIIHLEAAGCGCGGGDGGKAGPEEPGRAGKRRLKGLHACSGGDAAGHGVSQWRREKLQPKRRRRSMTCAARCQRGPAE
jgi:hypothetical protein